MVSARSLLVSKMELLVFNEGSPTLRLLHRRLGDAFHFVYENPCSV